jgi:cytochrome c-type biogenesis protein
MDFDVSYGGALLAGLLSFFSPCILPIVPPYLCYLAGLSLDQITAEEKTAGTGRKVFMSAVLFVFGFSLVFISFGASASFIGQAVTDHIQWLSILAGIIIIVMGLHFLGIFRLNVLYRDVRVQVDRKPAGYIGAFIMGLAFAFGWTPCVGPVLATILFVAGAEESAMQGAALLGVYALGIGVPFLIAAAFAGPFVRFMRRFAKHLGTIEKIMGAMLVITGILFLTGSMNAIGFWLQEMLPALGKVG